MSRLPPELGGRSGSATASAAGAARFFGFGFERRRFFGSGFCCSARFDRGTAGASAFRRWSDLRR